MGVPIVFLRMFLRKKKNDSGSTSVQIISKANGNYKVLQTIGSSSSEQEIQKLWYLGKQEIAKFGNGVFWIPRNPIGIFPDNIKIKAIISL